MGQALKTRRQQKGLTQVQVAKSAGVTERGYQRYEANEQSNSYREPCVTTAIRIAQALGVKDFDEFRKLWGDSGTQSTANPC